ncbi:MAG: SCO family protein [Parasphingopyxis sp.]|uniref:SCO family protein n=1 Tax=Parasphingopyxis sp. TaxID=1920299 RepID=UPI0032EC55D1
MNDLRRTRTLLALLVAAAIAACSGGAGEGDAPPGPPPLEDAAMGGPFELTSETGETVRDTDFAGQYRLIYFGYTFCPDVCPVDMQKLGQAMRALEERDADLAARVQPIFISVDPGRDTPEVLTEFTDSFHPRLLGLTGSPEVLADMVQRYGSYAEIPEGQNAEGYLVNHSNNVIMYGPEGEPLVNLDMSASPEDVAAEIDRWAS